MTKLNLGEGKNINNEIFYTKEEIVEILDLSIHTLNNWIKEYKPDLNEMELGKQNRRAYSKNYLIKIFNLVKRNDLVSKLNPSNTESKNSEFNQLILAKDETIQELKERIESMENQLKQKDEQIRTNQELLKNQQTLGLQQNSLLLGDTKSTKKKGFFSWLGFRKENTTSES